MLRRSNENSASLTTQLSFLVAVVPTVKVAVKLTDL